MAAVDTETALRRFDGKVVFITGVARGQGRSHCLRFAGEGAVVVGIDLCAPMSTVDYPLASTSDLDQTVAEVRSAGGQMLGYVGDVRDLSRLTEIVAETVERFGHIDVVVANAGISTVGFLADMSAEMWQETIDTNLTGSWNTIRAAVPAMVRPEGGSIVFVSSFAGARGMPGYGHYSASKHGVVGLTRSLAIELGSRSIRVNAIHPTGVATTMVLEDPSKDEFHAANPIFFNRPYHVLPVGMIRPDDVSDAVLWLASAESKYVTGTSLNIDAGASQL